MKPVDVKSIISDIEKFLIQGEDIIEVFKTVRDYS